MTSFPTTTPPASTRTTVMLVAVVLVAALFSLSCSETGDPILSQEGSGVTAQGNPGLHAAEVKTAALERAQRRLFDGAPPVIPHEALGAACISCHNELGMAVEDLGFSPPSPHELTQGMSAMARCEQCHVYQKTQEPWVETTFAGQPQDLRQGTRLFPGAPPTMPHAKLMRENCLACHSGAAAREEIRTTHPERQRCEQCHLQQIEAPMLSSFPI